MTAPSGGKVEQNTIVVVAIVIANADNTAWWPTRWQPHEILAHAPLKGPVNNFIRCLPFKVKGKPRSKKNLGLITKIYNIQICFDLKLFYFVKFYSSQPYIKVTKGRRFIHSEKTIIIYTYIYY